MTREFSVNAEVAKAIAHAVATARQSLQKESPRIDTREINRLILIALARVVAQELSAGNGANESDPVVSCMPWHAGTHFLVALQDELRRLYVVRSKMQ